MIPLPDQSCVIDIRVRYHECDPMGVAHHAVYPVWLEMGRTELLRQTGYDYCRCEQEGVFLAVVSLSLRYRQPVRYDEIVQLHTSIKKTGHVKIEHEYKLTRDDVLLTTGTTVLACLDSNGKARQLPEILLNAAGAVGS